MPQAGFTRTNRNWHYPTCRMPCGYLRHGPTISRTYVIRTELIFVLPIAAYRNMLTKSSRRIGGVVEGDVRSEGSTWWSQHFFPPIKKIGTRTRYSLCNLPM